MALLTLLLATTYDRYELVGAQMLKNPGFSDNALGWKMSVPQEAVSFPGEGTVRLRLAQPEGSVSLAQIFDPPEKPQLWRLSAEARTEGVIAGVRGWEKARLVLSRHGEGGRWLPGPHHVFSLTGDHDWRTYTQIFALNPDGVRDLRVSLQLPRATGTLWVRNLNLHQVAEKPAYPWLCRSLLLGWSAFLLLLLRPLLRRVGGALATTVISLVVAAILLGTLMPGELRLELGKELKRFYAESLGPQAELPRPESVEPPAALSWVDMDALLPAKLKPWANLSKLAHFALFALLAAVAALSAIRMRPEALLPDLMLLAGATELMQFLVDGRTPLVGDLLIDSAGACCGLLAGVLLRRRLPRPPLAEES